MKSPSFDYYAPRTLEEAFSLLAAHGESAKLLAGGQSLVPLMNFRLARPAVIIDLNRIGELSYIREHSGGMCIGAMTRQVVLETDEKVKCHYPLISEAARFIGHGAIRNRGTIGGSLVHADPAAELGAIAICMDAEMHLSSRDGMRIVPAREFFKDPYATCVEPTEILTEIRFPRLSPESATIFLELARREGDFALAGVAVALEMDDNWYCRHAKAAICGAGSTPRRAEATERALSGGPLTDKRIEDAASLASEGLDSFNDVHASSEYREHLARVLTYRALKAVRRRPRTRRDG